MAYDLDPAYKQVPERIADFKEKHPEGTLQSEYLGVERIGDLTFVIVRASAYRHPDDPRPGVGLAWERVPGLTPFTKNSELQNGETSAWGRAIVAALASESKSIASAEDVRNRQAEDRGRSRSAAGSRRAGVPAGASSAPPQGEPGAGVSAEVVVSTPAPPTTLSDATYRKLLAYLRGVNIETKDHDRRVAFLSRLLGREVTSSKELTELEAFDVIAAIGEGERP